MTDPRSDYDHLAGRLRDRGLDLDAVERALGAFAVETPSWGYGDSGTRFAVFTQPGRPRTVFERLDDAAEVQRLTGAAPAVALHFPWDAVDDLAELRAHAEGATRRSRTSSSASRSRASWARLRSRCGSPTGPTTPARTTCADAARG